MNAPGRVPGNGEIMSDRKRTQISKSARQRRFSSTMTPEAWGRDHMADSHAVTEEPDAQDEKALTVPPIHGVRPFAGYRNPLTRRTPARGVSFTAAPPAPLESRNSITSKAKQNPLSHWK